MRYQKLQFCFVKNKVGVVSWRRGVATSNVFLFSFCFQNYLLAYLRSSNFTLNQSFVCLNNRNLINVQINPIKMHKMAVYSFYKVKKE